MSEDRAAGDGKSEEEKQLRYDLKRVRKEKAAAEVNAANIIIDLEKEVEELQERVDFLRKQQREDESRRENDALWAPSNDNVVTLYKDHTEDCASRIEDIRAAVSDSEARYNELLDEMAAFNILHNLSSES